MARKRAGWEQDPKRIATSARNRLETLLRYERLGWKLTPEQEAELRALEAVPGVLSGS